MPNVFVPNNLHFRNVILFLFLSGLKIADIDRRMTEVYNKDAPSRSTISVWFHRFENGEFSLDDHDRSGRPMDLDLDALRNAVESDPFQTVRELSSLLGAGLATIDRGLEKIGKVKKLGRYVPHVLTQHNLDTRVDTCLSLLTLHRTHGWLDQIITGDEKWIYYDNSVRRAEWVDKDAQAADVPKHEIHEKKVMLSVWWSVQGVEYWELLDDGVTVTADVYTRQIRKLHVDLHRGKNAKVSLLHDNARPHIARKTKAELAGYGWVILAHPPYSPDLAPSDYHLFSDLQHYLSGKKFASRQEVKTEFTTFFNSQPQTFWQAGIHKLATRWQTVIDQHGQYI